ncbi:hypothetical protein Aduo_008722 [Ancylostoma duodenale]
MEYRSIFLPSTSREANVHRRRTVPMKSPNGATLISGRARGTTAGHDVSRPTRTSHLVHDTANAYISEVARKYATRMRRMKERSEQADFESESTSIALMEQRLGCLVGECDISRTTCRVPMCGRVFDSIPVLAWHMSYSHHDLAAKSAYDTLCFVCGIRMDNVKGKVIHLVSKHKALCASHNEQCLHQRFPVISPLAPAAIRLTHYSACEDEDEESNAYEDVVFEDLSGGTNIGMEFHQVQYD